MKCPVCSSARVRVLETAHREATAGRSATLTGMVSELPTGLNAVLRKRECRACGHRWGTVEVAITDFKEPAKRRGTRRALSETSVREIRELAAEGVRGYALAQRYGVSPSVVSRVLTGQY